MKFPANIKNIPKRKAFFLGIILATLLFSVSNLYPVFNAEAKTDTFRLIPENFSQLAEKASPAVVNIRTVKTIKGGGRVFRHFKKGPFGEDDPMRDFFDRFFGEDRQRNFTQRSLGSGFIIEQEGYIVTNNHVIENADKIEVILNDEKEFDAEIVGRDPNTDLALIKIKSERNLPVLKFGDSDTIQVGQWVVAIGNPFGLEQTVTAGIISAKGRVIGSGPYDDFLQTDASINPGNSGGPLLNMKGEVIGINTAIVAGGQGIGFAIPVNLAKGIIKQLRSTGEVTRGWLGVSIQDISKEVAAYYGIEEKKGVLVIAVFPGDPADIAGIQPRDIILSVNGKKVGTSRELTSLIANIGVDDTAKVKAWRNGKTKTFEVKIAKRDEKKIIAKGTNKEHKDELGMRVTALTPELAKRFNIKEDKGVIVVAVEADSKAAEAGVRTRDIIKEINRKDVLTVDDFNKAINEIKDGDTMDLFIWRMNRGFLVIKITK